MFHEIKLGYKCQWTFRAFVSKERRTVALAGSPASPLVSGLLGKGLGGLNATWWASRSQRSGHATVGGLSPVLHPDLGHSFFCLSPSDGLPVSADCHPGISPSARLLRRAKQAVCVRRPPCSEGFSISRTPPHTPALLPLLVFLSLCSCWPSSDLYCVMTKS